MKTLVAALGVVVFAMSNLSAEPQPVVSLAAGKLAGEIDGATHIAVFKGVPFAAPPVGELRWQEPKPVAPWSGTRQATKFGPSPMQKIHGDFLPWTKEFLVQNEVSEDCLYLNVWTPRAEAGAKLPVVVYVPGGAFVEGSGEVPIYDGANLAKKGLVVVTTNYRLGVFGFFAHPELTAESPHHASGNYGLMDQIAALRWVQQNIAAFGGDPERVTVWGQSAGAFSVGALLASPQAKGSFQRAIADSGLSLAAFPMKDLRTAEQDGLKYAANRHAKSLKDLRAISAEQLLAVNAGSPIVDGWFLPQSTNAINTTEGGSDVPVITGYQANDAQLSLRGINSAAEYSKYLNSQYGAQAEDFKKLYPAENPAAMSQAVLEGARDRQRVGMFLWAKQRGRKYSAPVYAYFFTRAVPWPQHPEFGAFHSGELPYFFNNLQGLDRPWEQIDHQLADITSDYIVNFVATGNPNGESKTSKGGKWPAVDSSAPAMFEIGETQRTTPLVDQEKLAFWTKYFDSREGGKAPPF